MGLWHDWAASTRLDRKSTRLNSSPCNLVCRLLLEKKKLVDVVSHHDDTVLEKYVGDEEITADDLKRGLRAATIAGEVVPVLCGSAFKNKAVQPVLDGIIDYLPSPLEVPQIGRASCRERV